MPDLTTIDDDRGRFLGLASVLLGVFVFVLLARNDDWSAFVDLLLFGIPAAAVIAPAYLIPAGDSPPAGWLSAMLVVGFFLTAGMWVSLADLLGANTDDLHASTVTWISILLAAEFAYLALRRNSAVCTLLAAAAAVVAVVAAVEWIFTPDGVSTFRYVFVVLGLLLVAAGVTLYGDRGRHGTVLTVAGGLVILALALSFAQDFFNPFAGGEGGTGGAGWGWELIVLAFGLGLAAFAAYTREPGPGYTAAILLVAFVAITTVGEDAFVGWPLVVLLLFGAALAGFLRGGPGAGGAGRTATGTSPAGPAETTHEPRL
jgi:hypothetical protein